MTEQDPFRTIILDNNQTLELRDRSRKIAQNAYVVIMEAGLTVPVVRDWFTDQDLALIPGGFDGLTAMVGDRVEFLHKAERNFILEPDRQSVFENLVSTFTANTLNYVAHESFPRKLIMKTYRDACKQRRIP
ncbi:MAG: hypothetical protein V1793_18055 [Pseudomonadota bacterium]